MIACGLFAGCGSGASPVGEGAVAHAEVSASAVEIVAPPAPGPLLDNPAPATELSPVEELKAQLQELADTKIARAESAAPSVEISKGASPLPMEPEQSDDVTALRTEIADLRQDVDRLQETVDAALAYLVGELGRENQKLRTDLEDTNHSGSEEMDDTTEVSTPVEPEPVDATPATQHVDYGEAGHISIKEWGRTPEQAAELAASKPGTAVTSLRGMICAVSPDISDDELKTIGKAIRNSCEGYDNVNIDIFNDEAAARDYADNNVRGAHLVMNITRHKASGQDVMVRIHANGTRDVVVE
ncbi:MAG: hypothetical protein SGI88_01405 [Candidatus Hydrogenedentes bacterium]|nr:hypothetical protein [Candidatus Hydrogenedentota bacterium]